MSDSHLSPDATNTLKPSPARGPIMWNSGFIHSYEDPLLLSMGLLVRYYQFEGLFKRVADLNTRTNHAISRQEKLPDVLEDPLQKFIYERSTTRQVQLDFKITALYVNGFFWQYVPCLPQDQIDFLRSLDLITNPIGESDFHDWNFSPSDC